MAHLLTLAIGSANELQYDLIPPKVLEFLQAGVFKGLEQRVVEVRRMATALLVKVSRERYRESRRPGSVC